MYQSVGSIVNIANEKLSDISCFIINVFNPYFYSSNFTMHLLLHGSYIDARQLTLQHNALIFSISETISFNQKIKLVNINCDVVCFNRCNILDQQTTCKRWLSCILLKCIPNICLTKPDKVAPFGEVTLAIQILSKK